MGKWREESATDCGHTIMVHEDWDSIPRFCKDCKAERAEIWRTENATQCGHEVMVHRDWDSIPRFCKACKEENKVKWRDGFASECRHEIKINRDWEREPALCKDCKEQYPPIKQTCSDCHDSFIVGSVAQYRIVSRGYVLPERCPDCRENRKMYMAALGALKDQIPYGIYMTVETSSLLGFVLDTVAVVRGKRDSNVVAEIAVVKDGFGGKTTETRMVEGVNFFGGRKLSEVRAETTLEDSILEGEYLKTIDRTTRQKFETHKVQTTLGVDDHYITTISDGRTVTTIRPTQRGGTTFKK